MARRLAAAEIIAGAILCPTQRKELTSQIGYVCVYMARPVCLTMYASGQAIYTYTYINTYIYIYIYIYTHTLI